MRNCPKNECVIKSFLSQKSEKSFLSQKTIFKGRKTIFLAQNGFGQVWTLSFSVLLSFSFSNIEIVVSCQIDNQLL